MAKNLVILEGVVLTEPPLRNTRAGVEVSNFMLRVPEQPPSIHLDICITVFGQKAIDCATKIQKGSQIRVNGRLGTSQNTKEMEILADNVIHLA